MPVRAEFKLNLRDYRTAAYYGMAQRNRTGLRLMLVVLGAFIIYVITTMILNVQLIPVAFFVVGGYAVWVIILCAGTETRIRRYIKDPETLLGKDTVITIDRTHVEVEIPEKDIHCKVPVKDLAFVFELTDLYMLYINGQETYLLPKRAVTEAEILQLRQFFQKMLSAKFFSRFLKSKKKR
ncbi:MAG: YcxB family protein [Lachnospiraceae bacterium]|nr:YcxB family protein [Lachnospiraceae bacterium]